MRYCTRLLLVGVIAVSTNGCAWMFRHDPITLVIHGLVRISGTDMGASGVAVEVRQWFVSNKPWEMDSQYPLAGTVTGDDGRFTMSLQVSGHRLSFFTVDDKGRPASETVNVKIERPYPKELTVELIHSVK